MLVNDVRVLTVSRSDTPLDFSRQHRLSSEVPGGVLAGTPGVRVIATRVKIDRCIACFRPSVNREVRLGDHDDARDALGLEPVKGNFQNFRVGLLGRGDHDRADALDVGEGAGIAARQFADDVRPTCFQFFSSGLAGESHLQAASAGACGALASPTFRRDLSGAAERSAGERLAAMARRACRPCFAALTARTTRGSSRRRPWGPRPIIPPTDPPVKDFAAEIFNNTLKYLDYHGLGP